MSDVTGEPVPGHVVDLLGLVAYAQLLAFDRAAADARLAPDLGRRAVISELAGAEITGFGRIAARLRELGSEPDAAMQPFRPALDSYHAQTEPSDWREALTKAYVGDSIADDFIRAVAERLGPTDRELILDVLHEDRYADFAAAEIRAALAADPAEAGRLSMWARRLVGEALRQAQRVAAERASLAALLTEGPDGGADVADLFSRLTTAHTERMASVGLNT